MAKTEAMPIIQIESTRPRLAWQWADTAGIGLLVLIVGVMAIELFRPGVQNVGDMLMSVYRVFELDQAWQQGVLYPRIGSSLNFGLGAPLFQYYPPLASYGSLVFHTLGLGYIAATKALMVVDLLACSIGVYLYVRWLARRRLGAATAAVLFLLSPYVLLVTYERGAVAESMALALLPWLVWSNHRLLSDQRSWSIGLAAVLVALTMMAHNITAMFVLPAVLVYCVVLALWERNYRGLGRVGVAFLLGLGLSAFYWLPALAELRFSRAEAQMLGGNTDVRTWLVSGAELVQGSLLAAFAGDDRFRYGLLMFLYGVAAVVTLPWQDRRLRPTAVLLAAAWVALLLLQLQVIGIFWQYVPLVRFIQFPWRLYGLATFCSVVLIGMLLGGERLAATPRWLQTGLAAALMLGAIAANTPNSRVAALPLWAEMREEKIGLQSLYGRGKEQFPLFTDYAPVSMRTFGSSISESRPPSEIVRLEDTPAPTITIESIVRNGFELAVSSVEPFQVKAPRAYFPGWQVYVDGAPVATAGSGPLGLVTATIPAGEHRVRIEFDQTPLRTVSDIVSWLFLAVTVVGIILFSPLGYKTWWLTGVGIAAISIALFVGQVRAAAATRPVPYGANLADEVRLLAYQIDDSFVEPGEKLAVKLYWYVQKTPVDDRKVFLHLNLPDDSGRVAQSDQSPLLGYYPTTQWEAGQIFADEYHVAIPRDTPPGHYVVTVGMYHPDPPQNLPLLAGPKTWPGDRMVLGEVEVGNGR
jgi:hypothetical protein